jgi:hypothetical protein
MKRLAIGACLAACLSTGLGAREVYKVTVTRVEKDLYRTEGRTRTYIETKYCHEYANRDEAVLRWEGKYGNNKLIFSSDTVCEVKDLR